MIAWLESVVPRSSSGSSSDSIAAIERRLMSEGALYRGMAPGTSCLVRGLEQLPLTAASGPTTATSCSSTNGDGPSTSSSSSSSSSSAGYRGAAPPAPPPPPPPPPPPRPKVNLSYDQLMTMRASALKAMLMERGINCSDCFDKESLAKRLLEECMA